MKLLKEFFKDETGQSTTEYILMLAVVVTIAVKFKTEITGLMTGAVDTIKGKITSGLE